MPTVQFFWTYTIIVYTDQTKQSVTPETALHYFLSFAIKALQALQHAPPLHLHQASVITLSKMAIFYIYNVQRGVTTKVG